MPKDTQQSFLAYYERRGKATPGPDEHYQEMTWNNISSKFGAGSKKGRQTFCEEAMAHSQRVPSPTHYDPEKYQRSVLGKME